MCWPPAATTTSPGHGPLLLFASVRVDKLAALPTRTWRRISRGDGPHGQRMYDWARLAVRPMWIGASHLARRAVR